MKLTAQEIAAYSPPDKADYIIHNSEITGFGLRVRGDRRSWIFQYSIGSGPTKVTRRLKIGDYPALPPTMARGLARDLHAKVHTHGDPVTEKRKNRSDAGNTFEKLAQSYLEFQRGELRQSSLYKVRRYLEIYARPLHALPLTQIDRSTIARRLDVIAKASGSVTANLVRASLSAMYGWALREGLVAENPARDTNKRSEKPRDRVLSDIELGLIWQAVDDAGFGAIVKLLILTAQRANEIAGLSWPEIDFDHGRISLTGERTKNGRAHEIPMADTAREILRTWPGVAGQERLFFSVSWGRGKKSIDARITETAGKPLSPWVFHDIRRSAATGMANIGILPHVIEAVLNHVSGHKGGVAGVYNRASYAAEKAQALARWDEHVRALVEGRASTVTPLRRA